MVKKLYIGNLPEECEAEQLGDLLKKFGKIDECDIISNKHFGFVHMKLESEAQEAVTQLDNTDFMGSIIKVQFSTTDVHKAPGIGSKGECFRCGSKGHLSRDCDRNGGWGSRGRGGGGMRGGSQDFGGRRFDGFPPRREPRRYREDPYGEDAASFGMGRDSDYLPMRGPNSRDFEYERRYLDEAYRRLGLGPGPGPREYEALYRSRSRSPVRRPDYGRSMYDADGAYYDKLYARPSSDSYFDEQSRSRTQMPSRASPQRY